MKLAQIKVLENSPYCQLDCSSLAGQIRYAMICDTGFALIWTETVVTNDNKYSYVALDPNNYSVIREENINNAKDNIKEDKDGRFIFPQRVKRIEIDFQ